MFILLKGALGAQESLRFIEEMLGAGTWNWDCQSGKMYWSNSFSALLGIEPGSCEPSFEALREVLHPDDRRPAEEIIHTLKEGLLWIGNFG